MYLIFMSLFMIMLLIFMILFLLMLISTKSIIDIQKSTPFECGFSPVSFKRLPFSIHFFLIAVIFLIFDIEIIIIMPLIIIIKSVMLMYWLMTLILFLTVLIMGLYHEWNNGLLNWTM